MCLASGWMTACQHKRREWKRGAEGSSNNDITDPKGSDCLINCSIIKCINVYCHKIRTSLRDYDGQNDIITISIETDQILYVRFIFNKIKQLVCTSKRERGKRVAGFYQYFNEKTSWLS